MGPDSLLDRFLALPKGWRSPIDPVIISNVLDSISDSIVVLNQDGDVVYANKATAQVLGYDPQDLMEKGLEGTFFLREENAAFNQLIVDAVWKKSRNEYSEVDYHHLDGSVRRLAATTSYLLEVAEFDTVFVGFVALFKDITEVHNLREKQKKLIQEKERVAREKGESLHKLAMNVAHEIRNPVAAVGGLASRILRNGQTPEEMQAQVKALLDMAHRLEVVVGKVEEYCEIPEATFEQADIAATVVEAVLEAMIKGLSKGITIKLGDAIPEQEAIAFDSALMRTALKQVLENAIDFSDKGATVVVSLNVDETGVAIEMKDSGHGISQQDLQFIFDPFFSTRTATGGMGLAIAQRIVQEHMGTIDVDSKLGEGTTVRICLPRLQHETAP